MNLSLDGISAFRAFIASKGFEPPERIEPGVFVRFPAVGKRGSNGSASAKLFPDLEGGMVWDWTTGEEWLWQAQREHPRTEGEIRAYRERCEKAKREAAAERERELRETAERSERHWKDSTPADDSHGYHKAKGIRSHGARVYRGSLSLRGMRCDGALVIPARTVAGDLVRLQFIAADGEKRYINGPVPPGAYFSIGRPDGTVLVAEGYSTAASLHESTDLAVAVAFDAGNLEATANALRAKFPDARLVLCADDDWKCVRNGEPFNPGIEAAEVAALAVGGFVAVPIFGADRPESATDFNDMHQIRGAEAVRTAIEAAQPPQVSEAQPAPEKRSSFVVVDGWPEPKPLPDGLSRVEAFAPELLPDALRPWIEDIGDRTQAPPDYLGVSAMVALGAVIGRQVGIRPQAESDWIEFPNLWGCLVGRPSTMKTPSMEAVLAPLQRLQADAVKRFANDAAEYELKQRAAKLRQEAGEKEARKRLQTSASADVRDCLAVDEPDEPQAKRYIANDTSYEALGEMHRGNPNGILAYRDELVSLLKGLDREDNASARGFYLSGWSGKQGYTFDRITRKGASIDAVCLSLLGSAQPGRIAEYVRTAVKGGAGDDGLLQRFGLIVWPDISGEWRNVDRWPDTAARQTAWAMFGRLDAIDAPGLGAEQDRGIDGELEGAPYLRLDPEALGLFREWHARLEARLRSEQEPPALESHFTKYKKLVPALALILHLASNGKGRVTRGPMLQALAWNDYLESHARRVYASLTNPENAAARAIVVKLRRGDIPMTFRAREVYRHGWANLSDRETVHDALELLADHDWVSRSIVPGEGDRGRFATEYQANPRGLA